MPTEGYSVRILLGWCGPPEPGRPRTVAAHTQTLLGSHLHLNQETDGLFQVLCRSQGKLLVGLPSYTNFFKRVLHLWTAP